MFDVHGDGDFAVVFVEIYFAKLSAEGVFDGSAEGVGVLWSVAPGGEFFVVWHFSDEYFFVKFEAHATTAIDVWLSFGFFHACVSVNVFPLFFVFFE